MLRPAHTFAYVFVFVLSFTLSPANAIDRYALVIGNSAYTGSPPLKNPKNDAELIARTLAQVGFNVSKITNANQKQMRRAMLDFSRTLRSNPGSIGLFYYAGHGVQVRGINYIVPVTADIKDEDEVRFEGIDVNDFLVTMRSSNARLNIVILDACRNNPLASSFRSATRGLAPVQASSGTLIAYSTAPGDVAFDGNGLNSPYSLALSRYILKQGLPVETVFKRVMAEVEDTTKRKQTPWLTGAFRGEFFFVTGKQDNQPPPTLSARDSTGGSGNSLEKLFWQSIVNSTNPASFKAYVTAFPKGVFVPLANLKIAELDKASKNTVTAAVRPPSSGTGHRARPDIKKSEPLAAPLVNAKPETATATATTAADPASQQNTNILVYRSVFPGSSVRRLTRARVEPLSCHKLWIARNEIDYRNGLCFKSEKAIRYFDNSNCTSSKIKLSSLEYRNKRTIRTWEIRKRCRFKRSIGKIKRKFRAKRPVNRVKRLKRAKPKTRRRVQRAKPKAKITRRVQRPKPQARPNRRVQRPKPRRKTDSRTKTREFFLEGH